MSQKSDVVLELFCTAWRSPSHALKFICILWTRAILIAVNVDAATKLSITIAWHAYTITGLRLSLD